ncbi:MAG: hypothetical protein ACYTG0_33220 [Planctomycetota bacterium]|jgi:hypothetical protein
MTAPQPDDDAKQPRPAQFSLKALFGLVAVGGGILALAMLMGPAWAGSLVFWTGAAVYWLGASRGRPDVMVAAVIVASAGGAWAALAP